MEKRSANIFSFSSAGRDDKYLSSSSFKYNDNEKQLSYSSTSPNSNSTLSHGEQ
jgi:hypothetical protein